MLRLTVRGRVSRPAARPFYFFEEPLTAPPVTDGSVVVVVTVSDVVVCPLPVWPLDVVVSGCAVLAGSAGGGVTGCAGLE